VNPHSWLTVLDPPVPPGASTSESVRRRWQCRYCSASGTWDELHQIACAYVYPPCDVCGQTPECAEDFAGIMAALGATGVRVVGASKPKLPEA